MPNIIMLIVAILNFVMLSATLLNVIVLSVAFLNVVMLSVLAPFLFVRLSDLFCCLYRRLTHTI